MKQTNPGAAARLWTALKSNKLFVILSILIASWCGIMLLLYPGNIKAIWSMNEVLLIDWFFADSPGTEVIKGWLAVLALLMALLALNIIVCVIDDAAALARMIGNRRGARILLSRTGILLMHAAYITIITGHLLSATTGAKVNFYGIETGGAYTSPDVPFSVSAGDMKLGPNPRGGGMAVRAADLRLDGGPFNDKQLRIKMKQTLFIDNYMFTLNSAWKKTEGCPEAKTDVCYPPELRVMRNPGLPVIVFGGLLFFPGIILRMIFRPGSQ